MLLHAIDPARQASRRTVCGIGAPEKGGVATVPFVEWPNAITALRPEYGVTACAHCVAAVAKLRPEGSVW